MLITHFHLDHCAAVPYVTGHTNFKASFPHLWVQTPPHYVPPTSSRIGFPKELGCFNFEQYDIEMMGGLSYPPQLAFGLCTRNRSNHKGSQSGSRKMQRGQQHRLLIALPQGNACELPLSAGKDTDDASNEGNIRDLVKRLCEVGECSCRRGPAFHQ